MRTLVPTGIGRRGCAVLSKYSLDLAWRMAALSLAFLGLMLILFTVAPAYFHWSLKTVPADENIRPDPPFMSNKDVAKGFWRR